MRRFNEFESIAPRFGARGLRTALFLATAGLALAACQDGSLNNSKSLQPIPASTVALMEQKGSNKSAPILIRAYKKEAELEIWKMRADGSYTHLKTYPMCRWSGQLGPKKREGDRQVPEGFYTVTPGQMNPNSQYYLAFNVGYPNALDRAKGYTGGAIMVHGACASAGCFSMTDEQMGEIYAIAREAFAGGQRAIQMQTMPFRMTAENLAKHRLDPNMSFWREIKEGYDHFEVTKREPQVAFCGRRYVFNASPAEGARMDANAACPPLQQDESLTKLVAQKRQADEAKVAELVASGVRPVKLQYADGGQHASFAHVQMVSRPEALERGPVEIALDDKGRPLPAAVQAVAARADSPALRATATEAAVARTTVQPKAAPASATAYAPAPQPAAQQPFYKRWLGLVDAPPAAAPAPAPATQAPPPAAAKPADRQRTSELPALIRGAQPVLPAGFMAYAPPGR
jgi:murein L,D-transpeptidase YafK